LDVNIGAGFDRFDHGKGVPMVGRADQNEIEIFLGEHLAVVGVEARGLAGKLALGDEFGGAGEHRFIDIAEGHDFDGGDLDEAKEVGFAIPTATDEPHAFFGVGECAIVIGGASACRNKGGGNGRGGSGEELPAIHDAGIEPRTRNAGEEFLPARSGQNASSRGIGCHV
jgi:hypothetical protein